MSEVGRNLTTQAIAVAWGDPAGFGRVRRTAVDFHAEPGGSFVATKDAHTSAGPIDYGRSHAALGPEDAKVGFSFLSELVRQGDIASLPSNVTAFKPDDVKKGALLVRIQQADRKGAITETLLGYKVGDEPQSVRDLLQVVQELQWPAPAGAAG